MSPFRNFEKAASFRALELKKERPFDLTDRSSLSQDRFEKYHATQAGIDLYYGFERIDDETLSLLCKLAEEMGLSKQMEAIQRGDIVNEIYGYESEKRPALHTALRDIGKPPGLTPPDIKEQVLAELDKLALFEKEMESYELLLCVGIGGSELGPKALYTALEAYSKTGKRVRFISNVDPDNLEAECDGIDLKKTLVVVISKTGTTLETATNEALIRKKYLQAGIDSKAHFLSVSQKGSPIDNLERFRAAFHLWPWVGGRYSGSSAIGGLIFTFAFGFKVYQEFLLGAKAMDQVARCEDPLHNLPMLGALFTLWNHNFLGYATQAIIPYSHALRYLAAHVQQVEMESNGKSMDKWGNRLAYKSCPVFWGEPGTNAQHSFFQMIHQGTEIVPIEFIGFKNSQREGSDPQAQKMLLSNLMAQSLALATGASSDNPNKRFYGNRPSHILFSKELTPETLGALFAYYEHKTAFEGILYGVNSFDQPGVELGKVLANRFLTLFREKEAGQSSKYDSAAEQFLFELIE